MYFGVQRKCQTLSAKVQLFQITCSVPKIGFTVMLQGVPDYKMSIDMKQDSF